MKTTVHSRRSDGGSNRTERSIVLPNGKQVQVSSGGREHSLSVEVLGVGTDMDSSSSSSSSGASEVFFGSERVHGSHEGMDHTVEIQGCRVRVHSWGRSHFVRLCAIEASGDHAYKQDVSVC